MRHLATSRGREELDVLRLTPMQYASTHVTERETPAAPNSKTTELQQQSDATLTVNENRLVVVVVLLDERKHSLKMHGQVGRRLVRDGKPQVFEPFLISVLNLARLRQIDDTSDSELSQQPDVPSARPASEIQVPKDFVRLRQRQRGAE
jgi:hypothetical protein